MSQAEESPKPIETIDDAKARISELESALDQSISLLIKRDDQILSYERQILALEQKMDAATEARGD
jgi:hypothetical protein